MSDTDWTVPDWRPGDSICIEFDDKTDEPRSEKQLSEMICALREVANRYNFDLDCYGTRKAFHKRFKLMELEE